VMEMSMDAMQYGFAGFAFLLLGVVVWMFKEVSKVVQENTKVITQFVDMVHDLHDGDTQNRIILQNIHHLLLARRCIAAGEDE